jgi:hypothetical protein
MICRAVVFLVLVCAAAPAARAQTAETRAGEQQRQREEKQKHVTTYEPTAIERTMDLVENKIVPLLQRDGAYAKLGNITTGSGFAYGAGWRDRSLVKGLGSVNLWAAVSMKRYWVMEAKGLYPIVEGGVLNLEGAGRIYEYPEEQFFGIGPTPCARTSRPTTSAARACRRARSSGRGRTSSQAVTWNGRNRARGPGQAAACRP